MNAVTIALHLGVFSGIALGALVIILLAWGKPRAVGRGGLWHPQSATAARPVKGFPETPPDPSARWGLPGGRDTGASRV